MPQRGWSRDELIVAFNLYCKIPFGRIHNRNPPIIELAHAIGRTPSALSWKLANFARLDPALKKRNIAGARHGAKTEIEVWNEFKDNWERLAFESERLRAEMTGHQDAAVIDITALPEGKTRETLVRTRINQNFFRAAILAAYGAKCCITHCSLPELLNASHIVPWAVDVKNRTNPRNGLCLNALHDRAFDCGLLTVTPSMAVKISPQAKNKTDVGTRELLLKYEGTLITPPARFLPNPEFLKYHNEQVFLKE